ncbi:hypothetical protein KY345_03585 [Candidatus Woesearchaeota archaeon]|nr:hypothetical protein [Candidatus Woesearchaeota archaeon]
MDFEKNKQDILAKKDKSKKGDIDKRIIPLCNLINNKENYFTVSSCSGRIVLIKIPEGNKKNEAEWLTITHELADFEKFKDNLNDYNEKEKVFFKMEGAILHVCCRTIEDAQKLIDIGRQSGFKHSGIFSTNKKIIVELISSEQLSAPVFDNKLLIDDKYLNYLINLANEKLKVSWDCIDKLEKNLKK